jgi:histidinol phosphatase-like enzyme
MSSAAVDAIHARMRAALGDHGVELAGIQVCPHEIGTCDCRKPGVGLFLAAARADPTIELDRSAVVGDSISDLEAGRRIGAEVFAVAEPPEPLVALATQAGITVAGAAPSLLDLVRTGALDAAGATTG